MCPGSHFSERWTHFLLKLRERTEFQSLEQTNVKNSNFYFHFVPINLPINVCIEYAVPKS
jgi:hypothetical protein